MEEDDNNNNVLQSVLHDNNILCIICMHYMRESKGEK